MTAIDQIEAIERNFRKRIRIVAENPRGRYSSTWMSWGNRDDFYFGARSILAAFKVSLHQNGVGYVAYGKCYLHAKRSEGIHLRTKAVLEWKLPP